MNCKNCNNPLPDGAKFCNKCGLGVKLDTTAEIIVSSHASISTENSDTAIIKCGNCGYVGGGEKNRSLAAQILAWICVVFAPLITILYFVATHKYRCPKCKSTFLGIKNEKGVFAGQRSGASRWAFIIIITLVGIAIIGILSGVVLTSLSTAREKAQEASLNANSTTESLYKELKNAEEYANSIYDLPEMIDEETRLDRIYASSDNKMNYDYTLVNYTADEVDWLVFRDAILPGMKNSFCNDSSFEYYREKDVPMKWKYHDMYKNLIGSIELKNNDCI